MKKISLLFVMMLSLTITGMKAQDGIAFWSHADGWSFDLDGDGRIDKTFVSGLPEDAKTVRAFVGDCNQDGLFDLCEVGEDEYGSGLMFWYFFINDGNNNFEPGPIYQYGWNYYKPVTGDYTGDGRMTPSVRVDTYDDANGWWLIYYLIRSWDPDVADANFQFGMYNNDILLAGDLNADGKDDLIAFNTGRWMCLFQRESGFKPGWVWKEYGEIDMRFGEPDDKPVVLDFNGDGHKDMGVFNQELGEIGFNLYSDDKPDAYGYADGFGSYDATYLVPAGIYPTSLCGIKKEQIPPATGIKNMAENKALRIYPNPFNAGVNNAVRIALSSAIADKNCEVSIATVAGQKVFSTVSQPKNGTIAVNIPALSKGIYFVTVENAGTTKLIIK